MLACFVGIRGGDRAAIAAASHTSYQCPHFLFSTIISRSRPRCSLTQEGQRRLYPRSSGCVFPPFTFVTPCCVVGVLSMLPASSCSIRCILGLIQSSLELELGLLPGLLEILCDLGEAWHIEGDGGSCRGEEHGTGS